jgi:ammonia channel protein AmtB
LFAENSGIFYKASDGDAWNRLGWNLAGVGDTAWLRQTSTCKLTLSCALQSVVIFVWAGGISFILFKTLSVMGLLRVTEQIEREGRLQFSFLLFLTHLIACWGRLGQDRAWRGGV